MPSKKQRTSKKKGKARVKSSPALAPTIELTLSYDTRQRASLAPPIITVSEYRNKFHAKDDLATAVEMLQGAEKAEQINAKNILRLLPNTSRDLKQKKIGCDEATNNLLELLFPRCFFRKQGAELIKCRDIIAFELCCYFLHPLKKTDLEKEVMNTLSAHIHYKFKDDASDYPLAMAVKLALDGTFQQFGTQLERYLGGRQERSKYRKYTLLKEVAIEDIQHVLNQLVGINCNLGKQFPEVQEIEKYLEYGLHLFKAVRRIAKGFDPTLKQKYQCWECEEMLEAQMLCSRCNIAHYCGRGCQRSAWNSGHKQVCRDLKKHREIFDDAIKLMEDAYTHGIVVDGETILRPSSSVDSRALMTSYDSHDMKEYYKNLRRIVTGEWWFFTNTPSVEEYHDKLQQQCTGTVVDAEKISYSYLDDLCSMLHFSTDDARSEGAGFLEHKYGVAMPAERFLDVYRGCASGSIERRYRIEAKIQSEDFFRKRFHKVTGMLRIPSSMR